MELKSLVTYKNAFGMMKVFLIVYTLVTLGGLVSLAWWATQETQKGYQSVWLIDKSGNAFHASQVNAGTNPMRIYEYQNHVKTFYKKWFEYDQYSFERNIEAGLYLIGNSGKELLEQYQSTDVLRRLQEKNMSVTIEVDSVHINMEHVPVTGYVYATQTIKRPGGKLSRNMNSRFELYDVNRSEENPHGVLIERFQITDNNLIENEK